MTSFQFKFVTGAAAVPLCALVVVASTVGSQAQVPEGSFGVGNPDSFLRKYLTFRAGQLRTNVPHVLHVRLGFVKGLSRSFTSIVGEITIDLESGAFRVSLNSLTPRQRYGVWLVDGGEGDGIEPATDTTIRLATFLATGSSTVVTGTLNPSAFNLPDGFAIDRVVVAPGSASPASPLAAGSLNVFQKIFFRRLSLRNESTRAVVFDERTAAPRLLNLIPDLAAETDAALPLTDASPRMFDLASTFSIANSSSAAASSGRAVQLDRLISQGATLFFEGTFGGNGRTCGTCHPARNNFTIDADFISGLPPDDPLFVAEFNPALEQLERPQLMRAFGLILENLDGLDDPTNKFVMRGVPHTLGLQATLARDMSLPNPPAEMTGWSGDGAPVTGSLRDFAIGAVTQHFTKSLARVEGHDFRRPSEHALDAMEAFQLSLGRSADLDLSRITFQDASVRTGQSLFINGTGSGGTCGFCHVNAGALSFFGQNSNFNTHVEDAVHPARSIANFPKDGGFGQTANPDGSFGNGSFNIAPVVEAADTPPFFHNNVVSTLEGVVEFYSGPKFNDPQPSAVRMSFDETQTKQIANFMRGVNVLQNIDVARRELTEILTNPGNPRKEQETRLQMAHEEAGDAIDVLTEGSIFPSAVTQLIAARSFVVQAQATNDPSQRRTLAQQANAKLGQARNAVATIAP